MTGPDGEDFEVEGEEEWMKLLEGYGKQQPDELPLETVEIADDEEEQGGQELPPDLDEMEVADESKASDLLAAVKERLEDGGQESLYHQFLQIISQTTVDHDAALAIIEGHSDLIGAFRRCFAAPTKTKNQLDVPASVEAQHEGGSRSAQLVNLVFANSLKAGHEYEQSKMLEYVKKRASQPAFPRRLIILRGAPGTGKTHYAQRELSQETMDTEGLGQGEVLARRLTHICSTDDFFMQFKGASAEMHYMFNARNLEAANCMNEARVRLAMEIGIDPLYVDNPNMQLWEMQPYAMLADRMGYVVTVISPAEIDGAWSEMNHLLSRVQEKHKGTTEKYVGRAALEAMINSFEALPDGADPRPNIRAALRPDEDEGRFGCTISECSTRLPPSALLYKFEKLLKEGQQLLRYVPPDGKGWGVNGEFSDDWHSFREKADGSCTYDDQLHWYTDDPESGWSLDELAMLANLRREAAHLPEAALPTSASHPSLFAKEVPVTSKTSVGLAKTAKAPVPKPAAPKMAKEAPASVPASVPASRSERFKHRMKLQREQAKDSENYKEEDMPPAKVARAVKGRASMPSISKSSVRTSEMAAANDDTPLGGPTEQEEVSASTFLAAVKTRLTEWGKVDQYHEFILALSGTVDAKAAVRILRGHDDLLRVFKRKFAPKADLNAIKSQLREEDGDLPHPPSHPPNIGRVKQELSSATHKPPGGNHSALARVKAELGADGPRPPQGGPRGIKEELGRMVKGEIKPEDMPRPPRYNPNAPRKTVTIGDDSDDDLGDEASIAAAVKKGKDECIAQLAKTLFRRERSTHDGARPRLATVRYATKVTSRPRFPRELFILRGLPGTGKTEYAVQQLRDYVEVDPEEDLAAKLTHVCAADDFFEQFKGDDAVYKFEASKLESFHCRNEMRVRLAMEAGVHPLYVDCANVRLWEMRPYVLLAERLGYVVTIIQPHDICEKWDDVAFLASANDTSDRRKSGKAVQKASLVSMLKAFEPLDMDDPLKTIKEARRTEAPRLVEAAALPPDSKPAVRNARQQSWSSWRTVKEEGQEQAGQKRPSQPTSVPSSQLQKAARQGKGGGKGWNRP